MTKFPLPAQTFPRFELPPQDVGELEALSTFFVEQTLVQYHEHEVVRRGVVDKTRWKKFRQVQDIRAYRERASSSKQAVHMTVNDNGSAMPKVMVVGTIPGDLFDVMYGVMNPTTEAMRIKSSYEATGLIDGCVLATLIKPSAEDPLRSLTLRWVVKGNPVVRNRDAVFIESTGIAYTKSGERIGYQLLHSVEMPGICELDEHQLVRADFSVCYIFRQKTVDAVDVFMRGVLNFRGTMPPSVGMITSADALVSVSTCLHCAEMKKLTWLLRSAKATVNADPPSDASQCAVCSQFIRSFGPSQKKCVCAVCSSQICSKCCVTRKISSISPLKYNEVIQTKVSFCVRCVERALSKSSIEIAVEEANGPNSLFEFRAVADSPSTSTSSSFSSPTHF